jgi:hypothetical protein
MENKMPIKNRILNYLKDSSPKAECVVTSDLIGYRVILSYNGAKLIWRWDNGLICPGSESSIKLHPLAAEALISEEVNSFFRMEGVDMNLVIFVSHAGEKTDGIIMHPPEVGATSFELVLKKFKIKELYDKFISDDDILSEEHIGEAISYGVLSPFLSLVNLNL